MSQQCNLEQMKVYLLVGLLVGEKVVLKGEIKVDEKDDDQVDWMDFWKVVMKELLETWWVDQWVERMVGLKAAMTDWMVAHLVDWMEVEQGKMLDCKLGLKQDFWSEQLWEYEQDFELDIQSEQLLQEIVRGKRLDFQSRLLGSHSGSQSGFRKSFVYHLIRR